MPAYLTLTLFSMSGLQNSAILCLQQQQSKRSPHGIWIGNLAFHVTPASLRAFLTSRGELTASQITRVHLPLSTKPLAAHPLSGSL